MKYIKNKSNKKIILVDGTLYLYRSYYKFYNLYNNNKLISIIYGMIYLINKIMFVYNPKYISIIFDFPCKNFRKIIFNNYKKNRSSCPKDLILQIPLLKKIINYMGISIISIPSVESDDVIGTLSKQGERNGFDVIIVSKDKDMMQLLSNNIKMHDIFSSKNIIGIKEIYYKYNINHKYIIDYFSLTGDLSDNIPGIYGIGPKTAKILIHKYKNIKNIYLNIDKIFSLNIKNYKNIIYNLKNYKDNLFLFYELIKIKTNIFTGYKIKDIKIKKPDFYNLKKIFNKYNISYKNNFFNY